LSAWEAGAGASDGAGWNWYFLYLIQLNDTTMSQIFRDENKTISPLFWKWKSWGFQSCG
jgi:hypothetical protein